MGEVATSALDLIGGTPLVALRKIAPPDATVFAKVESVNPGGSIKDRAARAILEGARARGELTSGQPVVEMTSGNMGAGLAVVCNVLGHPFTAVMSEGNSPERARMLEGLGAEVVLVPQADGSAGRVTGADIDAAVLRAQEVAGERGAFYVDQFANPDCVHAHEEGTGPEIWDALGDRIGGFVAAVGTGGTFVGVSRYLKRMNPEIVCAPVEPEGAAVLAGHPVMTAQHVLQGTGYSLIPPHWDPALADIYFRVSDDDATAYKRRLAEEEGLYLGYSSAANVCAAIELSHHLGGAAVITILCDTGLKY